MMQLQSPDVAVSTTAAQAIILRSSETTPVLIQTLQDASTTLVALSVDLLTKIGTDEAKKAVEAYQKRLVDKKMASLMKDLRDPKVLTRQVAAKTLNQMGKDAAPVASSLIVALDDKDPDVRQHSAEALGKIGTPEAQKALRFFPIKDKIRRLMGVFLH